MKNGLLTLALVAAAFAIAGCEDPTPFSPESALEAARPLRTVAARATGLTDVVLVACGQAQGHHGGHR